MIISELYGVGFPSPMIGLELELESSARQPTTWLGEKGCQWTGHEDRSLRQNGIEYVFRSPYWAGGIDKALEEFNKNTKDIKFIPSQYGSTHVHYNVGHLLVTEVMSIVVAWSILEDLFLKFCHPSRTGNLFAMRFSDTNHLSSALRTGVDRGIKGLFSHLHPDQWKYSALNLATIARIGTIEFRCYHSTWDTGEIRAWIDHLINFCEKAVSLGNPIELLDYADANLPKFIKDLVGIEPSDEDTDIVRTNMSTAFRLAFVVDKWESRETMAKYPPKKTKLAKRHAPVNNEDRGQVLFPAPTDPLPTSWRTPTWATSAGVQLEELGRQRRLTPQRQVNVNTSGHGEEFLVRSTPWQSTDGFISGDVPEEQDNF